MLLVPHVSLADAVGYADAFSWIGDCKFTGSAGQLHYVSQHDATIVEGDIDGDRHADFQIELTGRILLSASDCHL
jgi:hypothetical protein